ncbi:MAG TPA: FHA domain-containing protein [Polyangiaceae bacterium]
MALTIVVRSAEGKSAPRITFDAPRIVIGRGDGCEVRLPDPSVSHRHASIRQRGAEYIVMDEGSTNGTFAGPVKLSPQAPRVIRSGDLLRVGRVWLEVLVEQALPTQNGPLATRELALALVADALASEGSSAALEVKVVEGPGAGAKLVIDAFDHAFVVGRAKSADLDLDDSDLSRRHLEIIRRGERLVVRDLGSKNGSALGDKKLEPNEETTWPKGETLKLGKCRLAYEDPVGEALEELERAADERILASELIDPPTSTSSPRPAASPGASSTDTFDTSSLKRGAPITARPRRTVPSESVGWTAGDVFVALIAVGVLALSIAGLIWLMRSG